MDKREEAIKEKFRELFGSETSYLARYGIGLYQRGLIIAETVIDAEETQKKKTFKKVITETLNLLASQLEREKIVEEAFNSRAREFNEKSRILEKRAQNVEFAYGIKDEIDRLALEQGKHGFYALFFKKENEKLKTRIMAFPKSKAKIDFHKIFDELDKEEGLENGEAS